MGEGAEPTVLCRMDQPPGDHGLKIDEEPGYATMRAANPVAAAPFAVKEIKPDVVLATTTLEHIWMLCHAVIDAGSPVAGPPVAGWVIGGQLRPMLAPLDPRIALYGVSRYIARRAELCFDREVGVLPPPFFPADFRIETTRERVMFVNPVWPKGAEIASESLRTGLLFVKLGAVALGVEAGRLGEIEIRNE